MEQITKNTPDETEIKLLRAKSLAIRKESIIREAAYLPITLQINNIEVKQFTPMMFIGLDFAINPYLQRHRAPTMEDAIEFLWVVSTHFQFNNEKAKLDWAKATIIDPLRTQAEQLVSTGKAIISENIEKKDEVATIELDADEMFTLLQEAWLEKTTEEIAEYIENAFMDQDTVKREELIKVSEHQEYYCWITTIQHALSKEYGWNDNYLNLPFAQIFQLLRVMKYEASSTSGNPISFKNLYSSDAIDKLAIYINDKDKNREKYMIPLTDEVKEKLHE